MFYEKYHHVYCALESAGHLRHAIALLIFEDKKPFAAFHWEGPAADSERFMLLVALEPSQLLRSSDQIYDYVYLDRIEDPRKRGR